MLYHHYTNSFIRRRIGRTRQCGQSHNTCSNSVTKLSVLSTIRLLPTKTLRPHGCPSVLDQAACMNGQTLTYRITSIVFSSRNTILPNDSIPDKRNARSKPLHDSFNPQPEGFRYRVINKIAVKRDDLEWRSIERASVHGLQSHYWCNPLSFNNSMHLGNKSRSKSF